jgi:hypothetical protein
MTVVTSRCVTPEGDPAPGVYVYAWLRAKTTARVDGSRVEERVDTHTDRTGRWRLELPAATDMADPDAQWSIREVGFDAYLVAVPEDPGYPVEAGQITTVPGEPPTGGPATEHPLALNDLADVDAPPATVGVLERQTSGVVRPVPRAEIIAEHVVDPTPHPAYDDIPSLVLLFQNRLV